MIIDLQNFITREKPFWDELEAILKHLEQEPMATLSLERLERFHYLYERTSADLGRVGTFASEPEIRRFLETLVARAYGEIHEVRGKRHRFDPVGWFFKTFPRTFRRHLGAFWVSLAATLLGVVFGGAAIALDPGAKPVLMPFEHLMKSPQERVKEEESATQDRLAGHKASFSAFLMTHNIQVSILAFALGVTWGLGSLFLLFQNGLMLGAVAVDYILAGETKFLVGWLLPHGSFEIPAFLLAGQAGLILASALIGWRKPLRLRERLKLVSDDIMTMMFGVALMLVWAGFVESFFSQYHEPVLPYSIKITFGCIELVLLTSFLSFCGRTKEKRETE
jgi:uncharacterized membrane protein SpoIIM required for sporulation